MTYRVKDEQAAVLQRGTTAPLTTRAVPTLVLWMILTACLQGTLWTSGRKSLVLTEAVEQGAARAESRTFGEVHDDTIRKSIRNQRETLPFWTVLTLIGDFVFDPLELAARAVVTAVSFSALGALAGRPTQFDASLAECSLAQGFWVLGSVVQKVLRLALRTPDVETSIALVLPPGTYRAPLWVALHQIDVFALLGWIVLARCGWRRGQVNLTAALLVCGTLWALEATFRSVWILTIESGIRLMLIPEWIWK
jgi:hypothetical protein